MARWDERDPRWIVEERDDAKNVNNWHWTERNVTEWSKDKLRKLFSPLKLGIQDETTISIKEVTKLTGEASINNRKGKLLFFYEWTIKLEYNVVSGDADASGYVIINGLSEENTPDEIELEFEKKDGNSGQLIDEAKDMFRKEKHRLVQLAEQYREFLRTDATSGMQYVPKGDNSVSTPEMKPKAKANSQAGKQAPISKGDTATISLRETFQASTMDIYTCFTDPHRMVDYTQRQSEADPSVGGKFSMLGGIISGRYSKLVEGELIEEEWRMSDWPAGCVSNLQLKFVNTADGCQLQLEQRNVPLASAERTRQGWEQQIFQRIKMTFGYGVSPSLSL